MTQNEGEYNKEIIITTTKIILSNSHLKTNLALHQSASVFAPDGLKMNRKGLVLVWSRE